MSFRQKPISRMFSNTRGRTRGSTKVAYVLVIIGGLFVGAIAGFVIAQFTGLIPFMC